MSTGEQQKTTTGEQPVTNGEMKKALTWHDVRTIGTIIISIFLGGVFSFQFLVREAQAQVDAGTRTIERRTTLLENQISEHEVESARVHAEMKDNLKEVQADIRALYKAVMTREPQPRLERDGGTP